MTDPLFIPQSQSGSLRLFRIDPASAQARTLAEAPTPATIAASLGLARLPPGSAEVIRLADISAMGLRAFLIQGHDVMAGALGPGTEWLDALEGHVLIVQPSIAAMGAVTLRPGPGLSPLGVFAQGSAAPTPLSVPDPERPFAPGAPPSPTPKQRSGGAAILLLALVVIVVALGLFGVPLWPN